MILLTQQRILKMLMKLIKSVWLSVSLVWIGFKQALAVHNQTELEMRYYRDGHDDGYQEGREDGYQHGYSKGFSDGVRYKRKAKECSK